MNLRLSWVVLCVLAGCPARAGCLRERSVSQVVPQELLARVLGMLADFRGGAGQ